MKNCILALFAALLLLSGCEAKESRREPEIDPQKVYLFYSNSCPHCHEALAYINRKYPDLKITMVNAANPAGYHLMVKCARKFKLGNSIGTPLFCMGEQYLMGWAPQYESRFDSYVRPFIK